MIQVIRNVCTGCLVTALLVTANATLATVTSSARLKISGADVPATAAASVPIGSGDKVSTTDSAALVRFLDSSLVTLHKKSTLSIEQRQDKTVVCLLQGSFHYKLASDSKIVMCKDDKPLAAVFEGSAATGTSLKIPVIAAASAGGAAAIAGIARQRSAVCPDGNGTDHDCSPTQ
jgi:hypothetical protein